MFKDLVCYRCQKKMVRKGHDLICPGNCKVKYPIVDNVVITWEVVQEKNSLSKKNILKELKVSSRLIKDKSLGREYWERHQGDNYAAREIDEKAFRSLKKMLPKLKGAKVLVIGCGGGKDIEWLLKQEVKEVVGTDISLNLIKEAQKRFAFANQKPDWYFVANAETLPLIKDSFDIVIFGSALHHIPDYEKALVSACKASMVVALVAEPSEIKIIGNFLEKIDWCTEYGGLKTHRFNKSKLKSFMEGLNYQVDIETNFIWFPITALKAISNIRILVDLYFLFLRLMDKIFGNFGHNLTMVAKRKK